MRSTRLRGPLALLLVGSAAAYGVGLVGQSAAAAAAVTPSGGCWSYLPSGTPLDAEPANDFSTALEPWTVDPATGGVLLETAGATAVGGTRAVTVTIVGGPVLAPVDVAGTASLLLSVDGTPLASPVTVPFAVAGGEPVANLVAPTQQVPVGAAGTHGVRLDAVYFDAPGLRVACNGQDSGVPSGSNPATEPEPTDLSASWTTVAGASLTVSGIADQAVRNAARPVDVVSVQVAGLASSAPATVELCDAASACTTVGSLTTAPDGSGSGSFAVPMDAPLTTTTLRVGDAPTSASADFTVLDTQRVVAAEQLGVDSTSVTLTGTGWDPTRPVTIRGYAGADSSSAVTADPQVSVQVDAAGAFTATYEVADRATRSVIVDQARTSTHIGAVYLVSGAIGGAVDPDAGETPVDGDGEEVPSDDGEEVPTDDGAGGVTPGGVVTPVVPPEDIPLPPDLPVDQPAVPVPADPEVVEDLAVSEARLDGQATLSELFGGAPKRDLVFIVQNLGDATVDNPLVRVSVGRSDDVEPQVVDAEVGVLDPGEQAVVTVPVTLPMAAFGTYHVVGQVGETENGAFALEWTTFPWGLFALNALALTLLAVGVRHRLGLRRRARAAALGLPGGESVVDLSAADAWWRYRSGAGPKPVVPHPLPLLAPGGAAAGRAPDEPVAGEAVVDLAAAEAWWSKRAEDNAPRAS
ncbi:hypothetical protein HZF07_07705 [Nocardioides sp. CGMCC 1.13656]|uniref:hypothetical protein n=1 Tax=Nocardioides sp. CGMCC 1.13656 TaxID=2755556 RepID=UPI0015EC5318|nr:hypothetical protein [Nocardioides sp. CGMCC 1.13656]MBA2953593.1 hypothetical protein [Nocardioides sp. CGMCC 1.13656]